MANATLNPRAPQPPVVDRPENMADDFPDEAETGADEVDGTALPLAIGPLEPEYDDYTASWQNDYADAVGISRYKGL